MSDSFVHPWTVALLAPLSMGFARQEYRSGLPFLPPGDLPIPGIKPTPPALAGKYFTAEPLGKPKHYSSDINEVTSLQFAIAMCTT